MTSSTTDTRTTSSALRLTGKDVLAVLHRISTNALAELPAGSAVATLFCDFRGRLLHRAVVAHARDGAVWLLREDAPGDVLAAWVDRHVFREDVRIDDRSGSLTVQRVRDPGGPMGELVEEAGVPRYVRTEAPFALLVGEPDARLAASDEADRVEFGHAANGHEVADEFTPYEANLWAEVHLAKGCYTGQEALQRLVTYDSVRRQLMRTGGAGAPPAVPCDIRSGAETVGRVTTAIPDGERWIGLAILRRAVLESGASIELADGRALEPPFAFPESRPQGRP